jgi:hypothetical protein
MGVIRDTYDVVLQIFSSFRNSLKAVRRVPAVDDFLDRIERRFLNPIVVHRVTDPQSADLLAAMELYDHRIPDEQRFESADIIRWLREDREQQRLRSDGPRDYFLVAKFRKKVCGFSLFHFYGTQSLVFFAYMVAAKGPGTPSRISESLISYVAKMIRKEPLIRCKGFVLELEDPRSGTIRSETKYSLARIRLFCKLAETCGFTLRAVDVPYLQPPLSHSMSSHDAQEQLLLMCAYPGDNGTRSTMPKEELISLLEFIYLELYPEGYSADIEESEQYRRTCQAALERLTAQLPDTVRMLRLSELLLQIKAHHK